MDVIIRIILLIFSYVIGTFGFSAIFICGTFAIPTLTKLKRSKLIHKETPIYRRYLCPIILWFIILGVYIFSVHRFTDDKLFYAIIGLASSALTTFFQSGANENNVSELMEQNEQYLINFSNIDL